MNITENTMVSPLSAMETGLIPEGWGWTVEKDDLEGDINLAKLDFDYCPVSDEVTLDRADKVEGLVGSLGFAKIVLDAQKEGKDIIPAELRSRVYIVCSRTVIRDGYGYHRVAALVGGGPWVIRWLHLSEGFFPEDRLVRSR